MIFNAKDAIQIHRDPGQFDGTFRLVGKAVLKPGFEVWYSIIKEFQGVATQRIIEDAFTELKNEYPADYYEFVLFMSPEDLVDYNRATLKDRVVI